MNTPIINISEEAVEYIAEKGGVATIYYSLKGWCHSGDRYVPIVIIGAPQDNLEDYRVIDTQGIRLYVDVRRKILNGQLEIGVAKLFGWKKLFLEGGEIIL